MYPRQDKSSAKVFVFTKHWRDICLSFNKPLKNSSLWVPLLPGCIPFLPHFLSSLKAVSFPSHCVNWEWDALFRRTSQTYLLVNPGQMKTATCPMQWLSVTSVFSLGRFVSWIASCSHHMTTSTTYKLISGSHSYHTSTMFGACTIPAEAAVWLCTVKAVLEWVYLLLATASSKWSVGKCNATMFISMAMVPAGTLTWSPTQSLCGASLPLTATKMAQVLHTLAWTPLGDTTLF